MSQEVLVRGGVSRWFWLAQAVGPLLIVGGLFLDAPLAYVVQGTGLLIAAAVETYAWMRRRKRRWVRDLGDGFVVRDSGGVREIRDDDIMAVGLQYKRNFSQGVHKTTTRLFSVWLPDEPEPITMENKFAVAEIAPDPLSSLIVRIMAKAEERCRQALANGREIAGDSWALGPSYFQVRNKDERDSIPLDTIVAVDVLEDDLCLWRRGDDRAFYRVPISSRNCHFLLSFLSERLNNRSAATTEEAPTGLGRILFERRAKQSSIAVCWIVGVMALVGAGASLLVAYWIAGLILAVIGLILVAAAIQLTVSEFRCHEMGVYQKGLRGEKSLQYHQVENFTYSATRMYYNGAYTGTQVELKFIPFADSQAKPIRYSASMQNVDAALDTLRDRVAGIIAARMLRTFHEHGEAQWTPNMKFCAEGIEYRPSGFVKRKEPRLLTYEQLLGFDIQDGTFHLFDRTNPKSVMQESVAQTNFFPGYVMLCSLLHNAAEAATSDEPALGEA